MIPEPFRFYATPDFEFQKRTTEYMTSNGENMCRLTIGDYIVYADMVGDALFEYEGNEYWEESELTPTLRQLVREDSPLLEWKRTPALNCYLGMANGSEFTDYDIELDHLLQLPENCLKTPLGMKVDLANWLVRAFEQLEQKRAIERSPKLLTEAEALWLEHLKGYQERTIRLRSAVNSNTVMNTILTLFAKKPSLANVVSQFDMEVTEGRDGARYLTVAWISESEQANEDMWNLFKDAEKK